MNPTGFSNTTSVRTTVPLLLVLFVGLTSGGCQMFDSGHSDGRLTDWNNPAVGQMAKRMYLRTRSLSRQPQQKQLLNEVGSRLAGVADRPDYSWSFELVDDPRPDVIVFPGGNVVVTEGMIAACDNEAEFAAALAHELGHLLAGHEMHRPLPVRPGTDGNSRISRENRNPQDENEADSIAMSLLARAGYDPQALVTFSQNADANPERTAYFSGRGRQRGRLTQLNAAIAQAQQIYRANPQRRGLGIQIVRDESPRPPQPDAATLATKTDLHDDHWTAATDRRSARQLDPHGAAKPSGWNADLLDEGDWLMPVEGEIQQAGFEWIPADVGQ